MPIYKSTLIKFLKSSSSWLPLIITLIIVAVIGAVLPFVFLNLDSSSVVQTYKLYVFASVTTIGSATSIVSATFASYKSIQIYKQEIEEGTFLVLVSKPITRRKIIFEKWLALFTAMLIYVFILILFYVILVLLIDPGHKIANLDMVPIKDKIFQIGAILFVIILILILFFSSIALIVSSKISSAATIALVAGLGAIIPITGLLPTFTNKQSQTLITRPVSVLTTTRIPREKTISFINQLIPNSIDMTSISNLYNRVEDSYNKIEGNENDFIKNIGIYSGEKDIYKNLFYFDLNYQLSNISSIASDLLISEKDSNYISIGAMLGNGTPSPTLSKEVNITKKNIKVNEISKMILNTLNEYIGVTNSKEYGDGVFSFFDYILSSNDVPNVEITTNENFSNNLKKLISQFYSENANSGKFLVERFLQSPIINSMLNDKNISESLLGKLKDKDNPFFGEIRSVETLLLIKIYIELGLGFNLLFSSNYINNFYWKNEVEKFLDISSANEYLNLFSDSKELETIRNEYSDIFGVQNDEVIINLANMLLLSEKSVGGINAFNFKDYANKWVLLAIYSSITIILFPLSYFIIKKQDIR